MIILTIRTDKPEAELGIYEDTTQLAYEIWEAHRQLAETIHQKIANLLQSQKLNLKDIEGIVVYQGPGSFTGLRIGISVANALAYGLGVPIVGNENNWIEQCVKRLLNNETDKVALPHYGAPVHITEQRK